MTRRTSLAVALIALSAAAVVMRLPALELNAQAPPSGDHTAHLRAWDAHEALAQSSPYKAVNWSYIGPTNISGRMTDVAVADHGTSRRLYAGSCCGRRVGIGRPRPDLAARLRQRGVDEHRGPRCCFVQPRLTISAKTGVNDLAMDPTDPNTLYAAAWQRQRRKWNDPRVEEGFNESLIYKTTDAGKTWMKLTKGLPASNKSGRIGLAVAPSNADVVYAFYDNYECDTRAPAADAQGRGANPGGSAARCPIIGNEVYRSNDKGANWTLVSGQTDAQRTFMKGMSNTYA